MEEVVFYERGGSPHPPLLTGPQPPTPCLRISSGGVTSTLDHAPAEIEFAFIQYADLIALTEAGIGLDTALWLHLQGACRAEVYLEIAGASRAVFSCATLDGALPCLRGFPGNPYPWKIVVT
jgi:hypothetical protein